MPSQVVVQAVYCIGSPGQNPYITAAVQFLNSRFSPWPREDEHVLQAPHSSQPGEVTQCRYRDVISNTHDKTNHVLNCLIQGSKTVAKWRQNRMPIRVLL